MDLDPAQQRELAWLQEQRGWSIRSRPAQVAAAVLMSAVIAVGMCALPAASGEAWWPWALVGGLGSLPLSLWVTTRSRDRVLERFVRSTVPTDEAARRGGVAIQRDGVRNRPADEPPTPRYWDRWK